MRLADKVSSKGARSVGAQIGVSILRQDMLLRRQEIVKVGVHGLKCPWRCLDVL